MKFKSIQMRISASSVEAVDLVAGSADEQLGAMREITDECEQLTAMAAELLEETDIFKL